MADCSQGNAGYKEAKGTHREVVGVSQMQKYEQYSRAAQEWLGQKRGGRVVVTAKGLKY
jgi:hypothetical protein